MNDRTWSPQDRAEYDAMVASVVQTERTTEARVNLYEKLTADARQAHRFWAGEIDRDARRTGYREQIKRWMKRNRVLVSFDGRMVSKPRVVGIRQSQGEESYDVQALLDALTFDEIEAKRREYLRQVNVYTDNVALMDRLLALRDMAPTATTPAEACALLDLDFDEYLGVAA
jgi:hypothetical protein